MIVTVDSTDEKLTTSVQTFVDGFNDLRSVLASATSFEPESGATGPLFGDSRALRIDTDLSRLMSGQFFGVGPIQSLGSLGIRLEADGSLSFDAEKLSDAFDEDPDAVEQLFASEDLGFAAKLETLIDQPMVGLGTSSTKIIPTRRSGTAIVTRCAPLRRTIKTAPTFIPKRLCRVHIARRARQPARRGTRRPAVDRSDS